MAGEWFQHLVLSRKRTGSFALCIVLRSFHIIKDMCTALLSFCRSARLDIRLHASAKASIYRSIPTTAVHTGRGYV